MQSFPSKKMQRVLSGAVFLVALAVYLNTLSDGFVSDDYWQVQRNPWIKDVHYISNIFLSNVWGFNESGTSTSNYYRPLMHVIFMVDYQIFGLRPWGFHLVNIIFHAANSFMIFLVISRLLGQTCCSALPSFSAPYHSLFKGISSPPFVAGALFAVHPIHTEAVTWVSSLPELAFTSFYLLSFYYYMLSTAGNSFRKGPYVISAVLFFLASLSKETALTLPVILIIYDSSLKCRIFSAQHLRRYIPYGIVIGLYFIMRFYSLGGFTLFIEGNSLSIYQCLINIPPLFVQYIGKLLLPLNLNAWYVFHPISSLVETKGIVSLAISVFLVMFAFVVLRRIKWGSLGFSLLVVPLLPVLYLPAFPNETVFAERYLYLPSVGLVLLFALFLSWARERKPWSAISVTLVFVVLIGSAAGTVMRNSIWRNEYTLLLDMVKKSPEAAVPHHNLGNELLARGDIEGAIEQYKISLRLRPDYANAHYDLGLAYEKKEAFDLAVEHFERAIDLSPSEPIFMDALIRAYRYRR